jgi:hypothetical protein
MQEAQRALWSARGDVAPEDYRREPPESFDNHDFRIMDKMVKQLKRSILRLHDEVNEHITAYGAPRCSTLTQKMHEKLPKELRDLVYSHLFPTETIYMDKRDLEHIAGVNPSEQGRP